MIATLWVMSLIVAALLAYRLGFDDGRLYQAEKNLLASMDRISSVLERWKKQRNATEVQS